MYVCEGMCAVYVCSVWCVCAMRVVCICIECVCMWHMCMVCMCVYTGGMCSMCTLHVVCYLYSETLPLCWRPCLSPSIPLLKNQNSTE